MKFNTITRKNAIIACFLSLFFTTACMEETLNDGEFADLDVLPNAASAINGNSSGSQVSPNQIVVRFKDATLTETEKSVIRNEYKERYHFDIIEIETCNCNITDIELWTLNTALSGFTTIEELLKGLKNNEGEGDMKGERLITIIIKNDSTMRPYNDFQLEDRVVETNDPEAINIAIIDTGFDYDYLASPMLYNSMLDPTCDNEISGWDFANNDNNPEDDNGHGTLVRQVIGDHLVRKNVPHQFISLKAFNAEGRGSNFKVACALKYVVNNQNINIANMSFGWDNISNATIIKDLMAEMEDRTLLVASAGNDGVDTDIAGSEHFPSGFDSPNLLTVAGYTNVPGSAISIDINGRMRGARLHDHSNFGNQSIDVAAPFRFNLYLKSGNTWVLASINGTSYGTGFASARAAELLYGLNQRPTALRSSVMASGYFAPDLLGQLVDNAALGGAINTAQPSGPTVNPNTPQ